MRLLQKKIFILAFTLLLLTACSKKMVLQVDAIKGQSLNSSEKRYILKSGLSDVAEYDLYFKEFSAYAHHILKQRGYRLAEKGDRAALTIFLSYGISGTKSSHHRYITPTYGYVGGETLMIQTTTVGSEGDPNTTIQEIYVPARLRQTGEEIYSEKITQYTLYLTLDAQSLSAANKPVSRWRASVEIDTANKDLRNSMPYLAMTLQPYLGQDTGKVVVISLERENPEVLAFRKRVLEEKWKGGAVE